MKKITLAITPELMAQMGLTDAADEMAVATGIKNLADKAKKYDTVQAALVKSEQDKTELTNKLAALTGDQNKKDVGAILDKALTVDKKITVALKNQFEKDYAGNPEGLKVIIDAMPSYASITDQIDKGEKSAYTKYESKGWDEIMDAGNMADFKRDYPQQYEALHKKTFA